MGQNSLNSNVSSAAVLHNGFVGAIHIFVNLATRNNVLGITCQGKVKVNYLNVQVKKDVH